MHPTPKPDQDALFTCSKTMIREEWDLAIKTLQKSSTGNEIKQLLQQMIARCFFEQSTIRLGQSNLPALNQTNNK